MLVKELFGIALKIEGTGYEYYTKLSYKTEGAVNELLRELALQEREHARRFEEILARIPTDEKRGGMIGYDQEAVEYASAYAQQVIFPRLKDESVPESLEEALKKAIEVEKDSIVFYTEIKQLVDDKAVELILNEEKEHLKKLTLQLQYIRTSEQFLPYEDV